MLELRRLTVEVPGKAVIRDLDLVIEEGETVALFGPNGSGKTTLVKAVLGLEGCAVSGEMLFKGRTLNGLSTDERVRLGIGVMYQRPPAIRGVTLAEIAAFLTADEGRVRELAEALSLTGLLGRDVNLDFSGGELKRSELFQVLLQDPDLLLLDEPESGVDLENIALMGRALEAFLRREGKAALIITHTGYILEYVKACRGCVLMEGRFWCRREPGKIFDDIKRHGYEKCAACSERHALR